MGRFAAETAAKNAEKGKRLQRIHTSFFLRCMNSQKRVHERDILGFISAGRLNCSDGELLLAASVASGWILLRNTRSFPGLLTMTWLEV